MTHPVTPVSQEVGMELNATVFANSRDHFRFHAK